jgi:N-acyl homoserine lactone hydrolase
VVGPLPIHCWAIEHEDRLLLVDSGETAAVRDIPFARFELTREQELSGALSAAGLSLDDVSEVVLTPHHGDHVDGLPQVRVPVLIHAEEQHHLGTPFSRVMRRVLRQPAPRWLCPADVLPRRRTLRRVRAQPRPQR